MPKPNNKPADKAVALKYSPEKDYAPIIVASGHGAVAEKIVAIADSSGVPVYRDDSAASILTMLNVGQDIPPSMYEVIAGIYLEILKAAKGTLPLPPKKNED